MTESDELGQAQYQVRFDWGIAGARSIARDVDLIVVVDVFGDPAGLARRLDGGPSAVVAGDLTNASAIARWALERQGGKGDRFRVAVVAAGSARGDGSLRFALEDLLGAGAVIEALAEAGIDYYSPEAAAAAAAFTGLSNATAHLVAASEGGRQLVAKGGKSRLASSTRLGSSLAVPILREFGFGA